MATKSKVNLIALSPELDAKNLGRLEGRNYERNFTPIPNSALPASYKQGLDIIHQALTGSPLDLETNTYAVSAKDGIFKRLYAPAVFSTASVEDGEPDGLAIVWGDERIPLYIDNGEIFTTEENRTDKTTKFVVKEYGQWKDPSITVSVTKDGATYSFPFVVRPQDLKNKLSNDEFELLAESATAAEIAPNVQPVPSGESAGRFLGHFVKVSALPCGEYIVTGYREKTGGNYGKDYFVQAKVNEPFEAEVGVKNGEVWENVLTAIEDWCIVKPNTAMKKILAAGPIIDEENPAVLTVLDHYTTSAGNPAAQVALQCRFEDDDDSLGMDF